MRYLLDTNLCIYTMRHQPPAVREHFARFPRTTSPYPASSWQSSTTVYVRADSRNGMRRCWRIFSPSVGCARLAEPGSSVVRGASCPARTEGSDNRWQRLVDRCARPFPRSDPGNQQHRRAWARGKSQARELDRRLNPSLPDPRGSRALLHSIQMVFTLTSSRMPWHASSRP